MILIYENWINKWHELSLKIKQENYLDGLEKNKKIFEQIHKTKLNNLRESMIFANAYLFGKNDMLKEIENNNKGIKPNYTFFYKNDNALDDIVKHSPFNFDKPIKSKVNVTKDELYFEYEHYILRCFKMKKPNSICMRALRTWQVLIEDELYDMLDQQFINEVLLPMMHVYYLLGGRIVKVNKYKT